MQGVEAPALDFADKLRYLTFRILFLLIQLFPYFETLGSVLLILHFESLPPPSLGCPWSRRESKPLPKPHQGLTKCPGRNTTGPPRWGWGSIYAVLILYVVVSTGLAVAAAYYAALWAIAP